MRRLEHAAQVAVINWCKMARHEFPGASRIFAIPNGGKRDVREAFHLKQEGVRPGVPDLFLPVPHGTFHGLFIEMKSEKGKLTVEQDLECLRLKSDGYCVKTCFSSEEAIEAIKSYLLDEREITR